MTLPSVTDPGLWLGILHELDEVGGIGPAGEVSTRVIRHLRYVAEAELAQITSSGQRAVNSRVYFARHLMVERGLLDGSQWGVWRYTEHGREWMEANWRGWDENYSGVLKPARSKNGPREAVDDDGPSAISVGSLADLVAQTARGRHPFGPVEEYVIAVAAFELARYDDAITILDRVLSLNLAKPCRDKAVRLKEIATEKRAAEWEGGVETAKRRITSLLQGPFGPAQLREIRELTLKIDEMTRRSTSMGLD